VKFSGLTWEECGPFPVFACCTLAFALQLRIKAQKNPSQGGRRAPVGHDSMCRHGRLLRVARTSWRSRSPCFRGKPKHRYITTRLLCNSNHCCLAYAAVTVPMAAMYLIYTRTGLSSVFILLLYLLNGAWSTAGNAWDTSSYVTKSH